MMDIAEVARQSGFPASTLRYYEDRGLIVSVGRRGLRRMFEPAVLRRLALIALGRDVGFSLIEIAAFIGRGGEISLDRQVLAAKADELDARIRRLAAMRDELRRAAACPAVSHSECRNFQHSMETALIQTRRRAVKKVRISRVSAT